MAYTKTTYLNLRLSLAYRYGETSVPTSGDDNRNYWLNRGVQYCADKLGLKKSDSVTIASGVGNLPDDFKSVISVADSEGTYLGQVASSDTTGYDGVGFWITGNHTDGFVLHCNTDGDYTVWYNFYPGDMTSDSDICIIPDGEAVVAYAYGMLRKSETDPLGDAKEALGEADGRIIEMATNQSANEPQLQMKTLN